jgi:hypothetical protein
MKPTGLLLWTGRVLCAYANQNVPATDRHLRVPRFSVAPFPFDLSR